MHDGLTIDPVQSSTDIEDFIRFPFRLYKNDSHWVPPLLSERRDFLNPAKNPVFEYAQIKSFLARRNGRVVGTIAAIRNRRYGEFHPDERHVGFFGLYEAENDPEISRALFSAATNALSGDGLRVMRGPTNFTTNDVMGCLVEGFDDDPAVMMPYNPPYYASQFESLGFAKTKDLYAFDVDERCRKRIDALAASVVARGHCKVRPLNMRRFRQEIEFVRRCYNESWARNWGFVPWTDREMDKISSELKPLVDPRLACVGEVDGEPAGIAIAIPDANEALKLVDGRLFPLGLVKLLWKMKITKCERLRVMALGVLPQHRKMGLDIVMVHQIVDYGLGAGYPHAEVGWVLEDNEAMLRVLHHIEAQRTKVYRVYDKQL